MATLKETQMEALNKEVRTSMDIVCVIDISDSMSGQKIEEVQRTIKYLVS